MTFDHDFGYSFPLFYSLLKKEGRRKGKWISKNTPNRGRMNIFVLAERQFFTFDWASISCFLGPWDAYQIYIFDLDLANAINNC